MSKFLNLFEDGELICFAVSPFDTKLSEYRDANLPQEYFSINPLKDRRLDANVTVFRNLLLEFDEGSIEDQIKEVTDSKLPFTTMTFSGNKSIHVIISLDTPCKDRAEYDHLVRRIYDRFPKCDKSCRNPSRLSRIPEALRWDTKKKQSLLQSNGRVLITDLLAWLGPEELTPVIKLQPKRLASRMHLNTMAFLQFGAPEGQWNISLFRASADLLRCGLSKDDIRERLENITGYLDQKDNQTIASAFRAVEREERQ